MAEPSSLHRSKGEEARIVRVTIKVARKHRSVRPPKGTEELVEKLLRQAGCDGEFQLQSTSRIGAYASHGAAVDVRVLRHVHGSILIDVQPGGPDTRRVYWMIVPQLYRTEEFFKLLKSIVLREPEVIRQPAEDAPVPLAPGTASLATTRVTVEGHATVEFKQKHRPAENIPPGTEELVIEFLEAAGCTGKYILQVNIASIKADPPKGRGIQALECAMQTILLVVQPVGWESRRFYWLVVPPQQDTRELFAQLQRLSFHIPTARTLQKRQPAALKPLHTEDWEGLVRRLRQLHGEDELLLRYEQGLIYQEIWRRHQGDGINRISDELGISPKHIFEVMRFAQTFGPEIWIPHMPYRLHAIVAWHYQLACTRNQKFGEGKTAREWLLEAGKNRWNEMKALEERVSFYYGTLVVTSGLGEDIAQRLSAGSGWDIHPLARAEFRALAQRVAEQAGEPRKFVVGFFGEVEAQTKGEALAILEERKRKGDFDGFKSMVREKS